MKSIKCLLILTLLLGSFNLSAQIISKFTWDSDPLTSAEIGPDAIGVSSQAYSAVNGVNGTNGLAAGPNKVNIDFTIANNAIFDVAGIEVSFDYQRDESSGTFFKRGSSLIINGCAQLSVSFRVDDGVGGFNTVNSGSVYNIPNDDIFRNYRFIYIPVSGVAELLVDGTTVWTNDGPDGRDLYWNGAGNIFIGQGMDGTGFDRTFLDNFIIAEVINSALPVELLDFNAEVEDDVVNINWETASELNNDYFTVERSQNANDWQAIATVEGGKNSSSILRYNTTDESPLNGQSFYRLKQTDFDGTNTYSKVITVNFDGLNLAKILVYPNPTTGIVSLSSSIEINENWSIYNNIGQNVMNQIDVDQVNDFQTNLNLSNLPNGFYIINIGGQSTKIMKH